MIDDIESGAELDLRVAVEIFGKTMGSCGGIDTIVGDGGEGCDRCNYCVDWGQDFKPLHEFVPKPYSTDMTAAWTVVEKIGLGIRPVLVPGKPWKSVTSDGATWGFHPASEWEVTHPVDHHIILARHKSPAAAICLGALRALELLKETA